jgi:hypothetical protein
MNKISSGQAFALFMMISSFGLMSSTASYSSEYMAGILISVIIQALLLLPVIYLYNRKNFSIEILPKYMLIIYTVYFLLYGGFTFSRFYSTAKTLDFPINSRLFAVILIAGVCLYSAMLGLKAVSRGSVIILSLFIISLAVLLAGSYSKMDMTNFEWKKTSEMFSGGFSDLFFGSELAVIFIVFSMFEKSRAKCAYGFLGIKLIIAEFVSFTGTAVLGSISSKSKYPFFTVGAYSQPFSVQRADGIYIILFTMLGAVAITAFIIISSMLIKLVFPELKYNETAVTVLMLLISAVFSNTGDFGKWIWIISSALVYIILPFFMIGSDEIAEKSS